MATKKGSGLLSGSNESFVEVDLTKDEERLDRLKLEQYQQRFGHV